MKIRIIIILILGFSNNVFCCLMATQERIIPLGTSENCLIGIKILSNRYGEGKFGENPIWNYKFTLKGFNEDYSDYLIANLSLENGIEKDEIELLISKQINKALKDCEKLKDFDKFKPKEISFCDYQKDCSTVSVIKAESGLKFKEKKSRKIYPIKFLSSDYNGEIAREYKNQIDFYSTDKEANIGHDLKISSIRIYENRFYKLLIFHLGTGQEFEDAETGKLPKKEEYKFDKKLKTITDAIFIEPILHHGKGFDYYKMNEK